MADDQQFCLRWNNFQANITSQFEALRDDEDFTDVTIACEGQRLQAHKVVLSACSPFFKELFKTNPCSHPIIFMRDVEARHIVALMEFMYAGEVNVAQAHLSAFLKTAESLKIRGLTDTSSACEDFKEHEDGTLFMNPQPSSSKLIAGKHKSSLKTQHISSTSTVTSSQDFSTGLLNANTPPPTKRSYKDPDSQKPSQNKEETVNLFGLQAENIEALDVHLNAIQPKMEIPEFLSDDERDDSRNNYMRNGEVNDLTGGMEIIPQNSSTLTLKDSLTDSMPCTELRRPHSLEPRPCDQCGRVYSNLSNLRQHMKLIHYPTYVSCTFCSKPFKTDLYLRRHVLSCHDSKASNFNSAYAPNASFKAAGARYRHMRNLDYWSPYDMDIGEIPSGSSSPETASRLIEQEKSGERKKKLVKLGEGIEIYEDQLRSVKWSDYRKLTRGLATILFSPAELATCSVTGQRWSRAGSGERPVKPALDRAKVQAIISYVATRFPMVEISRIKQVLAYKCKENSTAFKMKAVRVYEEQNRENKT